MKPTYHKHLKPEKNTSQATSSISSLNVSKQKSQKVKFSDLISKCPLSELESRPQKKRILYKGSNAKILEFQKDFNFNFSTLDADKTQMLNYSRFSILLQSLYFIGSPADRSKEERYLILKSWKLLGGVDSKAISKSNIFIFLLVVQNIYDKSFQPHSHSPVLGKLINGIFCVIKEEVKNIHKAFQLFYRKRVETIESTLPENRAVLKKNLSFGKKANLVGETRSHINNFSVVDDKEFGISVLEKTIESHICEENFESKIGVKGLDSSNESLLKGRLRIRLSTNLMHSINPNRKNDVFNRSMTDVDKFTHFVDGCAKDGEDVGSEISHRNSLANKVKVLINFEEKTCDKVIIQIFLPNGVHDMIVLSQQEINTDLVEVLVKKYAISGNLADEFRRQILLGMNR